MKYFWTFIESVVLVFITLAVIFALIFGATDFVPSAFNPLRPLNFEDPENALTAWKFRRALSEEGRCLTALNTADLDFERVEDFHDENPKCHIQGRVVMTRIGDLHFKAIDTRCDTALRLVAWATYSLPAREIEYGSRVTGLTHFGSYNCRQMRTSNGSLGRMSKHATARALDLSGVGFENGDYLALAKNWEDESQGAVFMRNMRDDLCRWFPLVLSPDYNFLHKDHFHLDDSVWGRCR